MCTEEKPSRPLITAVIPCRNEREHIERCVRSVLGQRGIPGELEVIVADGMSDDGTREILRTLERADGRLRVIDNPLRITARAMNLGIEHARGEYIAIMGAHSSYAPDYLSASIAVSRATGADNVGGSMECRGSGWLQQAIAIAHHSPFSAGGARWHNTSYEGPADTVFGGVYRREVFSRIGRFDESLLRNQDDELNLRLTLAGGKIWHSPSIRSSYCPRASLAALFRQYMQYGYWKVAVMKKHGRPAALRHLVPGLFVLALLLVPALGLIDARFLHLWVALALSYAAANLAASVAAAARGGWRYLPALPAVFACYHLGYGSGFLQGVLGFVLLRRAPSPAFTRLTRVSR